MKKLMIFDCDGVLVDSEVIVHRVIAEVLSEKGYLISAEECIKKFTGLDNESFAELVFKESGIRLTDNFVEEVCLPIVLNIFKKDLRPLVLSELKFVTNQGFPKCIASNSSLYRVISSLKLTSQLHFFNEHNIFTYQQVKKGKPAPDLFLFAAKKMGYISKNCIIVEDSIIGIKAALEAKIFVIGFLGGEHAKFDWYREGITQYDIPIAHDTHELRQLISKYGG